MVSVAIWSVSLLSLGAAVLAAAPDPPPAATPAAAGPLKLRVAHVYTETYAWHRSFERFRDVLKAKSSGALDVEIYARGAGGTLVSELDYVSHLRKGALDGATVSPAAIATIAPEVAFLDLMYLWKDRDHWRRALDGDVGRRMADVIRNATAKGGMPGFEVLGYWGGNEMNIVSRSGGYQTLEDLAGVKIRVQDSPVQIELWKALGTKPSTIPYAAVKDALKEGSIDAAVSVSASTVNMRFFEGGRHVTETGHAITVRPFLLSGHAWKKLSAERRDWVMEAAREATTVDRSLEAQDDRDAESTMKTQHGVKFYPFLERDAMREQTQAVRDRVAKELKLEDMLAEIETAWDKGGARKKK
jgi:TRAP-type C4-dicarboxylate transport system substrate-binding protein